MNILVVCQYYYPENFQVTPICEQLVSDGHCVTVLTGLPNYPTGVVPVEYKKGRRKEKINGVDVIRCFEIGRKRGMIRLALNYLSFCIFGIIKAGRLNNDYDVVLVYQLSPVLMSFPGIRYAKKYKVPVFLYCCDLWPESMKMYINSERNPVFQLIKHISRKVYSCCGKIACQSESFMPYMRREHGIKRNRLTYLPAFAEETYLETDFNSDNGTTDFVFMGNLGIAQNLKSVLKAVEKIKDMLGFKVHFVGDGSCIEDLKEFSRKHGLNGIVVFHGRHSVEEMPEFYRLADVCLVSLKADNMTGLTLPSKVQGYMAAGKPIAGMINGSAAKVINESKCGVCVDANDIDGFASIMKSFIVEKEKYKDCGENGRRYFKEHFRRLIFMERLEKELGGLLAEGNQKKI